MTNTEKQIVAILDGPALVGGVPFRLIQFADGSGQVQSWRNQRGWVPGGCTLKELALATPCDNPEGAR